MEFMPRNGTFETIRRLPSPWESSRFFLDLSQRQTCPESIVTLCGWATRRERQGDYPKSVSTPTVRAASVNGMDRISWSCIYSLFLQQRLIDRPWWLYARLLDFLQLSWSEQLWSFPNDPGSSGHYIGNSRVLVQIWSNNRTRGCNNPTKTNTPQVSTHILPSIFQRDGACNYDGFPMIWVVMATTKEFLEFYY
jgi:hypothetical protein